MFQTKLDVKSVANDLQLNRLASRCEQRQPEGNRDMFDRVRRALLATAAGIAALGLMTGSASSQTKFKAVTTFTVMHRETGSSRTCTARGARAIPDAADAGYRQG